MDRVYATLSSATGRPAPLKSNASASSVGTVALIEPSDTFSPSGSSVRSSVTRSLGAVGRPSCRAGNTSGTVTPGAVKIRMPLPVFVVLTRRAPLESRSSRYATSAVGSGSFAGSAAPAKYARLGWKPDASM